MYNYVEAFAQKFRGVLWLRRHPVSDNTHCEESQVGGTR
jgi:hypothetical protein